MASADRAGEAPRRRRLGRWFAVASIALAVLAFLAVRIVPTTGLGRRLIEDRVNGLKVGRIGRLRLEGLAGDPWGNFTVRRVTIADSDGVWLDARSVHARWRPAELLHREARIADLTAARVTILRRFTPTPASPPKPSPIAIRVDRASVVLETLPAFSVNRGLFAVGASVRVARSGAPRGAADVKSLLHRGDRLTARFDFGRRGRFDLAVAGQEARGGALAGAFGLPADKDFSLDLRAESRKGRGSFTLSADAGGARAAEGSGAWTKAGGFARGRVSLAASTLLAPYQALIGPELRFQMTGAGLPHNLYAVQLNVGGDKAALSARGRIDPTTRATGLDGVTLDARLDTPARLVAGTTAGPLRVHAGLGGNDRHWVLAGSASLDHPAAAGFALAGLSGRFKAEGQPRKVELSAALRGEGATGAGAMTPLLGAAPTATIDIGWLGDGRTIVRQVALKGTDLEVSGAGQQGLLGDLTFTGRAMVADVSRAQRGARGGFTANWTARQSGRSPWTFSMDAKGAGFATGVEAVDHLLGPAPALKVAGALDHGVVNIASAALDGRDGSMTAAGRVGPAGALKIALNWRANGPLPIGPIEIDGAAKGTGDIGGVLTAPTADLIADFGGLGLPLLPLRDAHLVLHLEGQPSGLGGRIVLTAASEHGAARAAAAFTTSATGVEVSGLDAVAGGATVAGSFTLADGAPSHADLTWTAGPGAFLLQGHAAGRARIVEAAGGPRADFSLTGADLDFPGGATFRTLKLTADGPLHHLPYRADAAGAFAGNPWRLAGAGVFSQATAGVDNGLTFDGSGRVRGVDLRTVAPGRVTFGKDRYTAALALGLGGGRVDADVHGVGPALTAHATLTGLGLGAFDPDYTGTISGMADIKGSGPTLAGEVSATVAHVGLRGQKGASPLDGVLKATLLGPALRVNADLTAGKGSTARFDVSLPVEASSSPLRLAIARLRPMTGRFDIDAELAPLWDLTMGDGQTLAGHLVAAGTVGGTLADPRLIGTAALNGGRFADTSTGLKLQNVGLHATLRDQVVDVGHFEGQDAGKGSVVGSGRFGLDRDGVSNLQLVLKGFRLIDNDLGQATASGRIAVNRAADGKVKLAGALTIDRAQIAPRPPTPSNVVPMEVVEIHRKIDPDAVPADPQGRQAPVDLDVSLRAPGGIFIKGRGLNVELSLDAKVTGSTNAPLLSGAARVVRGDYDFAGQRFTLGEAGVVHLGSTPETIRLNLTATRDNPTLTAVIQITGTAAKPEITLTSTPVLPRDEVLSQVLFGSSVSSLNGFQAAQLASALSGLANGGGFDVIGGIRNLAHLDRLAINSTTTGGNSIAGGKYLRDNVYLELSGGAKEGPGAQVEWRIKKHLAIVSRVTSQGDQQISVRWRRDY